MVLNENGKKRILVISQCFYPEQFRINDTCEEWIRRGYYVTAVTGIPNYPQGKFYKGYGLFKKRRENYNGIDIVRLPLIPRGHSPFMLALNYLSFVVSGFFWKIFTQIRANVVFIHETSPMSQALLGVWFAKRRKIPCFLYVTDLWPENVEIAGRVRSKPVLRAIGRMVDYIYARCDRIFISSERFAESIEARGVPSCKLKYWPSYAEDFYIRPDGGKTAPVPEIPTDGKFNLIFAGNVGRAQGLDILPAAADLLKRTGTGVRFNIVGDGRYKSTLVRMVSESGVAEMFNFIESQPAPEIPSFFAACDAALICFSPSKVLSMTIPTKTQSCLACGMPVIVSADGEVRRIVEEADAGMSAGAGDPGALAECIREMASKPAGELARMGENACAYYRRHFDKRKLFDQMDAEFAGAGISTNAGLDDARSPHPRERAGKDFMSRKGGLCSIPPRRL